MHKALSAVIAIGGALIAASSGAAMSGNELFELARTQPRAAMTYLTGFVEGAQAIDIFAQQMAKTRGEPPSKALEIVTICPPSEATNGQGLDVVVEYLKRNPKTRHRQAAGLVWEALIDAWPCAQPSKK